MTDHLLQRHPSWDLTIAATGSANEFFEQKGRAAVDLRVSDEQDQSAVVARRMAELLRTERFDVVVVDELFTAVPISHQLAGKVVFVTDVTGADYGFPQMDRAVAAADAYVLADWPGGHRISSDLGERLVIAGPVVRTFPEFRWQDRKAPQERWVIALGSVLPRKQTHIDRILRLASKAAASRAAQLDVLASADVVEASLGAGTLPADIRAVGFSSSPEQYYRDCSVAVTWGGTTSIECAANGVPTVVAAIGTARDEARVRSGADRWAHLRSVPDTASAGDLLDAVATVRDGVRQESSAVASTSGRDAVVRTLESLV
ncbi:hypothetical protein [Kribbella sp. NPDC004536]|uniref:hypothetical protein n=1 Tax=Kribbella sp. NPDC004536 TaxID=3364106 RepID=UPI003690F2DC